jgi:hypothetical protein
VQARTRRETFCAANAYQNGTPLASAKYMRANAGRSIQMMDLLMLAIGLGFFALSVGYAYACERL